ncbi:hypothetical protein LPB86_03920 [Pedobacter sp. MC2016-14]|uniref:hypothetical protein n=1 Tax=Pedobacter sp. MC2016-14 TaxID=2897327 RepID=UPI001E36F006|nr:hypothetical protein [Pedobacter sp. MC2016-14]MCD0487362.1 hypothetical protein [Pedobacter sp. MC2016-14]
MRVDLTLIERLDASIASSATGCPNCLAEKFDISERSLYDYLKEMKKRWDAPIDYCHRRKTYYYTREFELYIGNIQDYKARLVKEILATIHNTF